MHTINHIIIITIAMIIVITPGRFANKNRRCAKGDAVFLATIKTRTCTRTEN